MDRPGDTESQARLANDRLDLLRNLIGLLPLPLLLWDERMSTMAAERALLEADTTRKRRSEVIDSVAAGIILQGALDRLTHITRAADESGNH